MTRLAVTLHRYRPAVWADLAQVYGVDGEALYRARRWRYLLDLIDGLPAASRTRAAMLTDPRVAEEYLRSPAARRRGESWAPDLTEWSLVPQLLAAIIDRLDEQRAVSIAATGNKPKKGKPFPRPRTAMDDAQRHLIDKNNAVLLAALTGAGPATT